jgi:hypothetical protein
MSHPSVFFAIKKPCSNLQLIHHVAQTFNKVNLFLFNKFISRRVPSKVFISPDGRFFSGKFTSLFSKRFIKKTEKINKVKNKEK